MHSLSFGPEARFDDDIERYIRCTEPDGTYFYSDPIDFTFPWCSSITTITPLDAEPVVMTVASDEVTLEAGDAEDENYTVIE